MSIKLAGYTQVRTPVRHRQDDPYWKTPVCFRKDGSPVYPVGGASPDDPGDDDDDTDDGDAGGDDGGDGDDLDDEIDAALGGGNDGGEDDTADLSDSEKKLLERLDKRNKAALAAAGQQIADRTVNAVLKVVKPAKKAAPSGGQGNGQQKQETVVDHTADIREGRAAYRELIPGVYEFASNDEREAALTIATSYVEREVRKGTDPDDAGKAAAELVAKTFKSVKSSARKQLLAQLAKDGRLLKKADAGNGGAGGGTGGGIGGQPNRVGSGATPNTDMAKGAAVAARLLPGRVKSTTTT